MKKKLTKEERFQVFVNEYHEVINTLKSELNENWAQVPTKYYHYEIPIIAFKHKTKDLIINYDLILKCKNIEEGWYRKKTDKGIFLVYTDNVFDYKGNWKPTLNYNNVVKRYKTIEGIKSYLNK